MAKISIPAVGERFLGYRPAVVKTQKVTVGSAASNDVVLSTQTTYEIADVALGVVVLDVRTVVNTAFTASVTLTIGDGDGAALYSASATIAPQAAVATGILVKGAGTYAPGHEYIVADTIDIVVGGADVAAGQMDIYITYIDNEAQL